MHKQEPSPPGAQIGQFSLVLLSNHQQSAERFVCHAQACQLGAATATATAFRPEVIRKTKTHKKFDLTHQTQSTKAATPRHVTSHHLTSHHMTSPHLTSPHVKSRRTHIPHKHRHKKKSESASWLLLLRLWTFSARPLRRVCTVATTKAAGKQLCTALEYLVSCDIPLQAQRIQTPPSPPLGQKTVVCT